MRAMPQVQWMLSFMPVQVRKWMPLDAQVTWHWPIGAAKGTVPCKGNQVR